MHRVRLLIACPPCAAACRLGEAILSHLLDPQTLRWQRRRLAAAAGDDADVSVGVELPACPRAKAAYLAPFASALKARVSASFEP